MLSTEGLTSLRTLASRALPDTASIQRLTETSDGAGGSTPSYAQSSSVACRVSRAGSQPDEQIVAERIQGRSPFTVFLPYGADVRESDRIVVTDGDGDGIPASAQTFEVIGVLAPTSWMVHVRCVCAREG